VKYVFIGAPPRDTRSRVMWAIIPRKPAPTYTYKGIRYCQACGNPDCPIASATPYWDRCPADPPPPKIDLSGVDFLDFFRGLQ
jgi:hypothetical protein